MDTAIETSMVPTPEIESNMEEAANILRYAVGGINEWTDFFTEDEYESYIVARGLDKRKFKLVLTDKSVIDAGTEKFIGRRGAVPNNKQGPSKYEWAELKSEEYAGFEIATNPTETINRYLDNRSGVVNELINNGVKAIIRELGINVMNLLEHGDLDDDEYVQVKVGRCLGLWSEEKHKLRVGYVLSINAFVYAVKE
jgi:hypothetical protein